MAEVIVRMGELAVTTGPDSVLMALGLGSCIGVCAHDPIARVSAMAHVVLPTALGKPDGTVAKSADVAVPKLIEEMTRAGASKGRIRVAIAGGAQLFASNTRMNIGARNIEAVTQWLKSFGIGPVESDTGGSTGRTVKLYTTTGTVTTRRAGQPEVALAELAA